MVILNRRFAAKTLTWRVISTGITSVGVLIVTGSFTVAGVVAAVDATVKSVAFYFHEHFWAKTSWGRPRVRLPEDSPDSEWVKAVESKPSTLKD